MILNPDKGTRYVIKKQGKYLVGNPYDSLSAIRYSNDKYDGIRFRNFEQAMMVAKIIGGKVYRINLLTGELKGGWK